MDLVQNSRNNGDSWDLMNKINEIIKNDSIQIQNQENIHFTILLKDKYKTIPGSYSEEF